MFGRGLADGGDNAAGQAAAPVRRQPVTGAAGVGDDRFVGAGVFQRQTQPGGELVIDRQAPLPRDMGCKVLQCLQAFTFRVLISRPMVSRWPIGRGSLSDS